MLRRKYKTYLLCDLALIIAVFWLVNIYEEHLTDRFLPTATPKRSTPTGKLRSRTWKCTGTSCWGSS